MATYSLSESPYLRITAGALGLLPIGLGVNAILRPRHALGLFEFEEPAAERDKKLADSLMQIYGARDLFMGLATISIAYLGNNKALGGLILASTVVALVDGAVSRAQIGRLEWNHWSFVPVLAGFGSVLLGAFDQWYIG